MLMVGCLCLSYDCACALFVEGEYDGGGGAITGTGLWLIWRRCWCWWARCARTTHHGQCYGAILRTPPTPALSCRAVVGEAPSGRQPRRLHTAPALYATHAVPPWHCVQSGISSLAIDGRVVFALYVLVATGSQGNDSRANAPPQTARQSHTERCGRGCRSHRF